MYYYDERGSIQIDTRDYSRESIDRVLCDL